MLNQSTAFYSYSHEPKLNDSNFTHELQFNSTAPSILKDSQSSQILTALSNTTSMASILDTITDNVLNKTIVYESGFDTKENKNQVNGNQSLSQIRGFSSSPAGPPSILQRVFNYFSASTIHHLFGANIHQKENSSALYNTSSPGQNNSFLNVNQSDLLSKVSTTQEVDEKYTINEEQNISAIKLNKTSITTTSHMLFSDRQTTNRVTTNTVSKHTTQTPFMVERTTRETKSLPTLSLNVSHQSTMSATLNKMDRAHTTKANKKDSLDKTAKEWFISNGWHKSFSPEKMPCLSWSVMVLLAAHVIILCKT